MSFYFAATSYQKAKTITLGIPFDRTSSFIPGSRFGPAQIRTAFDNVESYSPYQGQDLSELSINDCGDMVFPKADTGSALKQIARAAQKHLANAKRILAIGGEHTITIPLIQAYHQYYPELQVVQFDAHADLRDEYLGEKMCHATAMRRVGDIIGENKVWQLGIRSMAKEETKKKIYPFSVESHIDKVIKKLGKKPVYITLDIDVLDTGIMPAVATPEPGGSSFKEIITALVKLSQCRIVGADLVEYNPLTAPSLAYASTAAVLVREMLLILTRNKFKKT